MPERLPRIGITTGDPAGVGPEVVLGALRELRNAPIVPVILGPARFYLEHFNDLFHDIHVTDDPDDDYEGPQCLDIELQSTITPGEGTPASGAESIRYVDRAIELWKNRKIDAMVTGPVSKSCIEKSGLPFSGHTEYIARAIGESEPMMLMYSEKYRVLLVTTHLPLGEVAGNIDEEAISRTIETGHRSLLRIDSTEPRIAVAGLDPHCGDEGAIGFFDSSVTSRAIQRARGMGVDVEGPFSADTLFMPHVWEQYDLLIAQYHDQGLIPFKVLAFESGVNVTLNLSIVRTSVDHGTAFDIAGRGIAQHSSMVSAIELAVKMIQ